MDKDTESYSKGYRDGFGDGIREVVNWIKENDCGDESCVVIPSDDWEAKLREWGL